MWNTTQNRLHPFTNSVTTYQFFKKCLRRININMVEDSAMYLMTKMITLSLLKPQPPTLQHWGERLKQKSCNGNNCKSPCENWLVFGVVDPCHLPLWKARHELNSLAWYVMSVFVVFCGLPVHCASSHISRSLFGELSNCGWITLFKWEEQSTQN